MVCILYTSIAKSFSLYHMYIFILISTSRFHDFLNIDSEEAQMIKDTDKMYSKGSRLASEVCFYTIFIHVMSSLFSLSNEFECSPGHNIKLFSHYPPYI